MINHKCVFCNSRLTDEESILYEHGITDEPICTQCDMSSEWISLDDSPFDMYNLDSKRVRHEDGEE